MYWGIDLGGTKIEGIVLERHDPESLLTRQRIDTESAKGYDHIIHSICHLVNQMAETCGHRPDHIGIGTPGTTDPLTGVLKNSNTQCLNGRPFRADMEKALGIPVRMANDANCFALAEYKSGIVAKQYHYAHVAFGVIMGTGVGGGIVVNGEVLQGHHGIAGEWGHMFLDDSGEDCYCGRHGCVETILSGPALQRYYHSLTGRDRPLPQILKDEHDPAAAQTKQRLVTFFGKALAQVINVLDPDIILIGGGLGNNDFLYTEGRDAVQKNIFNPVLTTPIVKPMLGDSAGVFGAAMLFQ